MRSAIEYTMTREHYIHHLLYTVYDGDQKVLELRTKKGYHVLCGFFNKQDKPFVNGRYHNLDWLARDKRWMDSDRKKWFAIYTYGKETN